MTIIGIVAHEQRRQQAENLYRQVGACVLSVDDGTLGCRNNHLKVWANLAQRESTWAVVLEDDATPVPDFNTQLEQALKTAPTPIVSLYLGQGRPHRPQQRIAAHTNTNACWLTADDLWHAVAVAIHTNLIPDMLNGLKPNTPIDSAIGHWARKHHHTIAYTWPSLVDHQDGDSLIPRPYRPNGTRVAWRTGTRPQWTNTHVAI